jgi:hypothetical protein
MGLPCQEGLKYIAEIYSTRDEDTSSRLEVRRAPIRRESEAKPGGRGKS